MTEAKQSAIAWSVLAACGLLLAVIYMQVSLGCKTSSGGIKVSPPENYAIVDLAINTAYVELERVGAPVRRPKSLNVMFIMPTKQLSDGRWVITYNGVDVGGYTQGKMVVSVLDGNGNVQFDVLKMEVGHAVSLGNEKEDYVYFHKANWISKATLDRVLGGG